uniref:Uncharacterized protein n=1 Tax=Curvibacter symbiont subsp. Hydra magnipapillata TaxID=667019 RepID=C9YAK8_CURXX|nr:hypothetical protein Csp_A11590 [Curvibacter putative symbiont of Hydra magnipapillata]
MKLTQIQKFLLKFQPSDLAGLSNRVIAPPRKSAVKKV